MRSALRLPIAFSCRSSAGSLAYLCTVRSACAALLVWGLSLAAGGIADAQAQQRPQRLSPAQQEALRAKLNESTLIVATSHPNASYLAMAHDITAALGRSGDIRVLPIASNGGTENLRDLLFLRGVDMAIVPANALAHAKASEWFGGGLQQRIAYITQFYSEELHLLVGPNTKALEELRGKKVAVPADDGNAQFTASDLFKRFGLEIEAVRMNPADAIDRVRSGELAAVLLMGGKPLPFVSGMPKDGSLRLLGLPFSQALEEGYSPAAFRAEDYPALIPADVVVETVAVSAVLMANNARGSEESSQRIAKFVPALFVAMSELPLLNRHAKWKEVNLAASLPGWSRFGAAEEWLNKAQQQQAVSLQKNFEEFLRETQPPGSAKITPAQQKKLFDEFVSWTRNSVRETDQPTRR